MSLRAWCVTVVLGACTLAGAPVAVAAGPLPTLGGGLTVAGAVTTPASYSVADLGGLAQTTASVAGHSFTGVSLAAVVNAAGPVLPSAKNASLRVTIAVAGAAGRTVTIALGELDPSFGNHPAILALAEDGAALRDAPDLLVAGDTTPAGRFVRRVTRITIAVQSPTPTAPPSAGAITVHDGPRTVVLSAARLAALPSQTLTVSFKAGTSPQTHTEIGPTLDTVLAAAGIRPWSAAWVAAVGSDGYVATVTPAEAEVGGRPLLISLDEDGVAQSQPRLVVDGDVKGGRYVSGVDDLYVGRAQPFWASILSRLR
jgi:hypothetical protein